MYIENITNGAQNTLNSLISKVQKNNYNNFLSSTALCSFLEQLFI